MPDALHAPIPRHGLFRNLTGQTFGRLTVVGYLGRIGANNQWDCACSCGNRSQVSGGNLRSGHTTSCGCLHKEKTSEASRTHGGSKSVEYRIWAGMKTRCYDPTTRNFHRYGGRGISVCERWKNSFEAFISDLGPRPSNSHSIDRIDNNGNYEPGNCRWATVKQQANNRSDNVLLTINGVTKTLAVWADESGLARSVVASRLASGDAGSALIRPSGMRTKRITFNGVTDTYLGWSKRLGIKPETISQRIRREKWSVEKALTHGV